MTPLRTATFTLLVVVAVGLAACGSDGGDTDAATGAADPAAAPVDAEQSGSDQQDDEAPEPQPSGGPLDFEAPVLSGGSLDTTTLAGGPVVLWFWAPWCTTCRGEAPNVSAVATDYGDQVTFLGVAGRGDIGDMERFVQDTGVGGFDHLVDADGALWTDFGVFSQPAFAFIDGSGEVEVVVGAMGRDNITDRVEGLLDA